MLINDSWAYENNDFNRLFNSFLSYSFYIDIPTLAPYIIYASSFYLLHQDFFAYIHHCHLTTQLIRDGQE